ncbi:hypothetical protein NKL07_21700 [Mesorhizobium sp. C280B]|uniref:hypothetical protein n=1 Tax=unclassified Mesorhizobium TaxID=325217 RepID=UPI0003CEF2EE|nr:hypothetical protein [Mesorhizobium sp. LSJC280B00]ESW92901.1 hypothetical protein X772_02765 [Mesorhizobium sp. LSJC280B00]
MLRLPEITFPLSIDTIGKALAMGEEFDIHCLNTGCHHSSRLNLVALGQRIGFDHSCLVQDIAPYFFCPKCRAAGRPDKRIGLTCHTLTREHSEWPRERQEWRQRVGRARADPA